MIQSMMTIFDIMSALTNPEKLTGMVEKTNIPTRPAEHYIARFMEYGEKEIFGARIQDETVIAWAKRTGANITTSSHPHYVPRLDQVRMPPYSQLIVSGHNYISALLHEMVHWTGHKSRLDRQLFRLFEFEERLNINTIGKQSIPYCEEEIIAELAAAQLALDFGTEWNSAQSGAYIDEYVKIAKFSARDLNEIADKANEAVAYLKRWPL